MPPMDASESEGNLQEPNRPASRIMAAIAWVPRQAWLVLGLSVLLTVFCGFYVARNFSIDTDTNALLSRDLPFQRNQADLNKSFPQLQDTIVAVVDGPTPALARKAAARLAVRLGEDGRNFLDVYWPGGDFFARNGLLYLEEAELEAVTERLTQAQPLISSLAANPSVQGLADLMGLAASPEAESGPELAGFDVLLDDLAATVEAANDGRFRPVAWSRLMSGASGTDEARQFVIVKPRLDTSSLEPAGPALQVIRTAAEALGLTSDRGIRVRLTGSAALDTAQVHSATEGASGTTLLSFGLLAILLGVGLYSVRLAIAILLVLLMSFIWSAAFGLAVVGPFNLISIAFAVLFIGLGVDFGIQFAVRYGEELARLRSRPPAVHLALLGAAKPLTLAAVAAAISFYSAVPTDYSGLSALGAVAGTSMLIALAATLTVLPALLSILPAGTRHMERARFSLFADIPIYRHKTAIVVAAGLIGVAALPLALLTGFDFDPARLQDPRQEAVETFEDLRRSDGASLYPIDVLAPDLAAADALAERLSSLKSVKHALTLDSYVPDDQDAKLARIQDLALIIPPFSLVPASAPTQDAEAVRAALLDLRTHLDALATGAKTATPARRLVQALERFQAKHGRDDAALLGLQAQLVGDLPETIDMLRRSLEPEPVTRDTLPPDLRARYVDPRTGRARVEIFSALDLNASDNLRHFVQDVQTIAPHAAGAPVLLVEGAYAIVDAFRLSTVLAAIGIFALLMLVLRNVGRVLLVFLPLILSGVLTSAAMNLAGISFNLANIIVLPLLMGLGVAFGIYFVLRWAEGRAIERVLQTSMPYAVLLSGLATMIAFGSMAVSKTPGMAILGQTLSIALFNVLLCVLVVLPAVLAVVQARAHPRDPDADATQRPE